MNSGDFPWQTVSLPESITYKPNAYYSLPSYKSQLTRWCPSLLAELVYQRIKPPKLRQGTPTSVVPQKRGNASQFTSCSFRGSNEPRGDVPPRTPHEYTCGKPSRNGRTIFIHVWLVIQWPILDT